MASTAVIAMDDLGAIDYESPFPECRVLSTADPRAMIRVDMTRDAAALFAKQVQHTIEQHDRQYAEPDDELITLGITMTESTFERFAIQIGQLVVATERTDEPVSTQIVLDEDLEPGDAGVSVAVIINDEQLQGIYDRADEALAQSDGDLHRWEFSCNRNGAQMLVQQLTAAVYHDVDDPIDHIEPDDIPAPDEEVSG